MNYRSLEVDPPNVIGARVGGWLGTVRTDDSRTMQYMIGMFHAGNRVVELTDPPEEPVFTVLDVTDWDGSAIEGILRQAVSRPFTEVTGRRFRRITVEDATLCVDLQASNHLVITSDTHLISIMSPSAERHMATSQYLREMGYRRLVDQGFVCFHASAVATGGKAFVCIGDSGNGKSTLALALGYFNGAMYMANERVLLRCSGPSLEVTGVPSAIKVNAGTLQALGIRNHISSWELLRPQPAEESDWESLGGRSKLSLLPGEVAKYLGIAFSESANLGAVLLPTIMHGTGSSVFRCPPDLALIQRNCFTPYDPVYEDDWLGVTERGWDQLTRQANIVQRCLLQAPWFAVEIDVEQPILVAVEAIARCMSAIVP